ncbi:alpha/beta hydrolase [Rhizobium binxianense]
MTVAGNRQVATPVTFAGTIGLFMPVSSAANTAVLFLSPWGFEEMCARKFWRVLAEDLAASGVPSLRFDYAGTGDALDVTNYSDGLEIWQATARGAAEKLRELSGCRRLIVIAQGLGSVIAERLANEISDIEAIAFLAPVVSGRFYLRELSMWSRIIDDSMGLPKSEGVSIAGLKMPEEIANAVRRVNLMETGTAPANRCLVLARPERPADQEFAAHLRSLGETVDEIVYEGYDELVSSPSFSKIPRETVTSIVEWVRVAASASPATQPAKAAQPDRPDPLIGDGFRETPVRFGKDPGLFGVLCEPAGTRKGATAIILTTAYDRAAGWSRSSVTMARDLARSGIPSIRFDSANVADSPPRPDAPEQILYSDTQNEEVFETLDLLETCKLLPAILVGRCSGGYLAFQASALDSRISGLIAANPYVFYWDRSRSVDDSLRFAPRSLETYKEKFQQMETLKRLLRGGIDVKNASRNIVVSLLRRAARLGRPLLEAFPFLSRQRSAVVARFQTLKARKVDISLIYSAHDSGLEQLNHYFGQDGILLKKVADAGLTIIPDADHNLTQPHAQSIYIKEIRDMALRIGSRRPSALAAQKSTVRSQTYAGYPASRPPKATSN